MRLRGAGRPREFDEVAVLDRAVDAFWTHGHAGTTTRILETALDMRQSSIYNAFGSKQSLLHRSLDHYLLTVDRELVTPLAEHSDPTAIERFLDALVDWISSQSHPGCLMLNIAAEMSDQPEITDRATRYRARVRAALDAALQSKPGSAASVDLVLAGVLGLNLAAASGAQRAELTAMADALKNYIRKES